MGRIRSRIESRINTVLSWNGNKTKIIDGKETRVNRCSTRPLQGSSLRKVMSGNYSVSGCIHGCTAASLPEPSQPSLHYRDRLSLISQPRSPPTPRFFQVLDAQPRRPTVCERARPARLNQHAHVRPGCGRYPRGTRPCSSVGQSSFSEKEDCGGPRVSLLESLDQGVFMADLAALIFHLLLQPALCQREIGRTSRIRHMQTQEPLLRNVLLSRLRRASHL